MGDAQLRTFEPLRAGFEVDYPHADTTFPHTKEVATRITSKAGLDESEIYKLLRGNAIEAYGLGRFGIDRQPLARLVRQDQTGACRRHAQES